MWIFMENKDELLVWHVCLFKNWNFFCRNLTWMSDSKSTKKIPINRSLNWCERKSTVLFIQIFWSTRQCNVLLCWLQAPDVEVEQALDLALKAGYRWVMTAIPLNSTINSWKPSDSHIDCAPVYQNEKVIGRVLKGWVDSGRVKREELFITTKLPPTGKIFIQSIR